MRVQSTVVPYHGLCRRSLYSWVSTLQGPALVFLQTLWAFWSIQNRYFLMRTITCDRASFKKNWVFDSKHPVQNVKEKILTFLRMWHRSVDKNKCNLNRADQYRFWINNTLSGCWKTFKNLNLEFDFFFPFYMNFFWTIITKKK